MFTCRQVNANIRGSLVFVPVLLLQRLVARLTHKEKEASKLAQHLDFERVRTKSNECKRPNHLTCETEPLMSPSQQDTVKTTEELSRILESTRDHLESQLSRAEAEKIQLAAQIQVCGLQSSVQTQSSRSQVFVQADDYKLVCAEDAAEPGAAAAEAPGPAGRAAGSEAAAGPGGGRAGPTGPGGSDPAEPAGQAGRGVGQRAAGEAEGEGECVCGFTCMQISYSVHPATLRLLCKSGSSGVQTWLQ